MRSLVRTSFIAASLLGPGALALTGGCGEPLPDGPEPTGPTQRIEALAHSPSPVARIVDGAAPLASPSTSSSAVLPYAAGGRVLSSVRVNAVFWGPTGIDATVKSQIPRFYAAVTKSPHLDWLSEYNTNITAANGAPGTNQTIGRGSLNGSTTITPGNTHTTLSDSDIQTELASQIDGGHLSAPDASSLYMVHFPHGVRINAFGLASCVDFCAYHFSFTHNGNKITYGVLPDMSPGSGCDAACGASTQLNNQTTAASHEMIEAITDPDFQSAWFSPINDEIGDICNGQQAPLPGTGYTVQKEWSNAANTCVVQGPAVKPVVCGRGVAGISCAVSTGHSFSASSLWTPSFSDAQFWNQAQYYSTIQLADVNGDGRADVCGRGVAGVYCALANGTGTGLGTATLWQTDATSAFSDGNRWNQAPYYSTIRFADVNGDGRADVCGRGFAGVYCALSNGTGFAPATLWQTTPGSAFSDGNSWNQGQYYSTIQLADLDGDGKADVCGRGGAGVNCALSSGTSFGAASLWQPGTGAFSDGNGWSQVQYYSTIQLADVNGDGKADVCGRGGAGVNCALSSGTSFGTTSVWQPAVGAFSDANSWNQAMYYSTIRFADLNGDGKADLCGRGGGGINCELSSGAGFGALLPLQASFSDANGWNQAPYYSTIQLFDLNNDGLADVCGRGSGGINCALSNGAGFGGASLWQTDATSAFSDANSWNQVQYGSTIRYGLEH